MSNNRSHGPPDIDGGRWSPDETFESAADRPREATEPAHELRHRLERLPHGHPSSPYQADGTRKPPPPDLTKLELPLPDEPDFRPEQTNDPEKGSSVEVGDDKARTYPDGSWEWKGWHLPPEHTKVGNQALESFRTAEGRDHDGRYGDHGLTPAMRRLERELVQGHLADRTEDFALKSPDRFKEKLAKLIARNPDKPPRELARDIHDAVRYTFIFKLEGYCKGMWDIQSKLQETGFELEVRRSSWTNPEYKGINTRWCDPTSGLPFEVQCHTQGSWDVKQATHDTYEKIADPRTPPEMVARLRAHQREMSSQVEIPSGAVDIPDYRREGR